MMPEKASLIQKRPPLRKLLAIAAAVSALLLAGARVEAPAQTVLEAPGLPASSTPPDSSLATAPISADTVRASGDLSSALSRQAEAARAQQMALDSVDQIRAQIGQTDASIDKQAARTNEAGRDAVAKQRTAELARQQADEAQSALDARLTIERQPLLNSQRYRDADAAAKSADSASRDTLMNALAALERDPAYAALRDKAQAAKTAAADAHAKQPPDASAIAAADSAAAAAQQQADSYKTNHLNQDAKVVAARQAADAAAAERDRLVSDFDRTALAKPELADLVKARDTTAASARATAKESGAATANRLAAEEEMLKLQQQDMELRNQLAGQLDKAQAAHNAAEQARTAVADAQQRLWATRGLAVPATQPGEADDTGSTPSAPQSIYEPYVPGSAQATQSYSGDTGSGYYDNGQGTPAYSGSYPATAYSYPYTSAYSTYAYPAYSGGYPYYYPYYYPFWSSGLFFGFVFVDHNHHHDHDHDHHWFDNNGHIHNGDFHDSAEFRQRMNDFMSARQQLAQRSLAERGSQGRIIENGSVTNGHEFFNDESAMRFANSQSHWAAPQVIRGNSSESGEMRSEAPAAERVTPRAQAPANGSSHSAPMHFGGFGGFGGGHHR